MEREDPRDAFVSNRYARAGRPAAGRRGRHLQPAPRGAAARAAPGPEDRAAARQPRHAPAQARRRQLRRHRAGRRRPEAPGPRPAHPRRCSSPNRCCPPPGRARWASRCGRIAADLLEMLAPLAHQSTWLAVAAERAVSRAMGGSCSMPLAAFATFSGEYLQLRAAWGDPDTATALVRAQSASAAADLARAAELGHPGGRRNFAPPARTEAFAPCASSSPDPQARRGAGSTHLRAHGFDAVALPLMAIAPVRTRRRCAAPGERGQVLRRDVRQRQCGAAFLRAAPSGDSWPAAERASGHRAGHARGLAGSGRGCRR